MGMWSDFKEETGYDKVSDFSDRAKLRTQYISLAKEEGYSAQEAVDAMSLVLRTSIRERSTKLIA